MTDIFGEEKIEESSGLSMREIHDYCMAYPHLKVLFELNLNAYKTCTITGMCSWRGSYHNPALVWEEVDESGILTAGEVGDMIRAGMREVHHGYKGGDYVFLWGQVPYVVPQPSSQGRDLQIVDIDLDRVDGVMYLKTKHVPW